MAGRLTKRKSLAARDIVLTFRPKGHPGQGWYAGIFPRCWSYDRNSSESWLNKLLHILLRSFVEVLVLYVETFLKQPPGIVPSYFEFVKANPLSLFHHFMQS